MLDQIAGDLKKSFDAQLVDELIAAYQDAKRSYYLSGLRLNAVEGGRFCEAVLRMLEHATTGKFTPLGKSLDTEKIIARLANLPNGSHPDSLRLHIPRSVRVVYDIRNKRDAAHLGDDIDPNLQDATLVISCLDWMLAEFVRIYHKVPADKAQIIIEGLVQKKVPAIQDFDGFLKVLKPNLGATDFVLLLLYERGQRGATIDEISAWVRPTMRGNLRRTLTQLVDDSARAPVRRCVQDHSTRHFRR